MIIELTFDYDTTIQIYCNEATCREWVEAGFRDLCERYNCKVDFKNCTITGLDNHINNLLSDKNINIQLS